MGLTRDQILSKRYTGIEKFEVPEWGGEVYLRHLTNRERSEIERVSIQSETDKQVALRFRWLLLGSCMCDESGNRLFAESDEDAFSNLSATVIERMFNRAIEINSFAKDDIEDVSELAKNSESGPDTASG